MRGIHTFGAIGCLLFTSTVGAAEGEPFVVDTVPQVVAERIKATFVGAELLHAQKEVEGGKEYYIIRIKYQNDLFDAYVSPDGAIIARKQEMLSLRELLQSWASYSLVVLVPGLIAGAGAKWLVGTLKGGNRSVLVEWGSAWLGAVLVQGAILVNLATVPYNKDVVVVCAICIVWGGISASLVEVLGLTAQAIRGSRVACQPWIIRLAVAVILFLMASIPVEMLRIERENQYFKDLALKLSVS